MIDRRPLIGKRRRPTRSAVLWAVSAVLLVYLVALTANALLAQQCHAEAGQWTWTRWHCRPAPAIEIRRELERT